MTSPDVKKCPETKTVGCDSLFFTKQVTAELPDLHLPLVDGKEMDTVQEV